MDLIDILRYSYLSAALAVLFVAVTPPLRNRFLAYGARESRDSSSVEKEKAAIAKSKQEKSTTNNASSNILSSALDAIADWKVPHDYFWTFYFMSVVLSAFWPPEALYLHGALYQRVVDNTRTLTTTMSFEQVKITWIMLLVQGGRRMYECLTLSSEELFGAEESRTSSKMWGGHWVLGLLFYIATSVAFWIEGIPAIQAHTLAYSDLAFKLTPTFRTIFSAILFMLASGFQHDCHTYLAYLKKTKSKTDDGKENDDADEYKLPTHPAFQPLIAPHYTAECLIYLSLALVSAPQGAWINLTMASALVFVTVNLGVTASVTRSWYENRFGHEAVRGKWRMIPPIY